MEVTIPANERRGALWVHPQYQKTFVTNFCLATFGGMLATSLLLAMLFYMAAQRGSDLVIWPLIAVNALVLLALVALAGVVALNLSHKVGGPLYRIEKRADEMARGQFSGELHLRNGDELHSVAHALNQLSRQLNHHLIEIGDQVNSLAAMAGQPQHSQAVQKGLHDLAGQIKQGFVLDD